MEKKLTKNEAYTFCLEHYEEGGAIVESYWFEEYKPMTKQELLKVFANYVELMCRY